MSAKEKSDLPEVAEKRANKAAYSAAAELVERRGRGQGECGTAKHGPDAEPGSHVTGAGPHTRSRQQEQTGQADGALASPHHRCSAGKLLWSEEVCRAGRRRDELDRI